MVLDPEEERESLENDGYLTWALTLFEDWFCDSRGRLIPPAEHHREFWEWVWSIEAGESAVPFVGIWPRGGGKALAVDTPIPTPYGWTAMGELRVGDAVYDHRGQATEITALTEVSVLPCAEMAFGRDKLIASLEHGWKVLDRHARRHLPAGLDWALDTWREQPSSPCAWPGCEGVARKGNLCSAHAEQRRNGKALSPVRARRTRGEYELVSALAKRTGELLSQSLIRNREHEYAIPTNAPLVGRPTMLPITPYVLGAWLGDGTSTAGVITVGQQDRAAMCELLSACGPIRVHERPGGVVSVTIEGLYRGLRLAGLINAKAIPACYLRAPVADRLALLRGLLDTDGGVLAHGSGAEFTSIKRELADGCAELARTLGYRVTITEARATLYGRDCGPKWRLQIRGAGGEVFGLPRKREALEAKEPNRWSGKLHMLDAVKAVAIQRPVRCIEVASPAGLYLAGEAMIPTHNSSAAEMACIALAARGRRKYALWVCESQGQADDHVSNVASLLESSEVGTYYPQVQSRMLTMYGQAKAWRRNRLRTASGFTLDALGLDTAARGVKLENQRPDLMVFDDLDGEMDSTTAADRKIKVLTRKLLPAGSSDLVVLAIQNLVHPDSIFARLADGRADFLVHRKVSGPHPALNDFTYETKGNKTTILTGTPTWAGQDVKICQKLIDDEGITAFLEERQHEVEAPPGGMFDHLEFNHCAENELPALVRTTVWVDPAVSHGDKSDSHGIQADSLGVDGRIYRRFSWERRTTPQDVIRRAILVAVQLRADTIGIETDQGGLTWESVCQVAWDDLVRLNQIPQAFRRMRFVSAKAGSGLGPKAHRWGQMLVEYEREGRTIIHVLGTHGVLEKALRRAPKTKPFDLCDAAFWSWAFLRNQAGKVVKMTWK